MSSDSNPVMFSGRIKLDLVTNSDGKSVMQVSGLQENIVGASIAVSGTNLIPSTAGEAHVQSIETNNTLYIGSINAPTTINQSPTTNSSINNFDEVFHRLEGQPIEDRDEVKKLINELKESITTSSPEKSRSIFRKITDRLRHQPEIPNLIATVAARVYSEYLKSGL